MLEQSPIIVNGILILMWMHQSILRVFSGCEQHIFWDLNYDNYIFVKLSQPYLHEF